MIRTIELLVATLALSSLLAAVALAADMPPELPVKSPRAHVSQRVGLTEIEIDYSSPAVRGRRIFGKLVPYKKLWRTGANACTKLEVSRPVKIAGKKLPAGTYSLFTIPGRRQWTVILNKKIDLWGTRGYKAANDVLRVKLRAKRAPFRERMTFIFSDFSDAKASLDLEWSRRRVSIPIELDTNAQALANIEDATAKAWRVYADAARYMLETKQQFGRALELVDASIAIRSTWFNQFIKAQLLAGKKRYAEAYQAAKKAHELGQKAKSYYWRERVEAALAAWKHKK